MSDNLDILKSLDQSILAQLREDMGEDIHEVLDAFIESIDELLGALKGRSKDDSNDTISRWAHSIKSSAASIGMMKVSALAAQLEKAQKQGESIDIDAMIKRIDREYQLSRALLEN